MANIASVYTSATSQNEEELRVATHFLTILILFVQSTIKLQTFFLSTEATTIQICFTNRRHSIQCYLLKIDFIIDFRAVIAIL